MEGEVKSLRSMFETQKESLESQYENKILQINVKLKKEELALLHFQHLAAEQKECKAKLEGVSEDFSAYRRTSENTVFQHEKEMKRVTN